MRELLKAAIVDSYYKWTDKGYAPVWALQIIKGQYNAYHALGGNGTVTQLVEELRELPKDKLIK